MLSTHRVHHATLRLHGDAQAEVLRQALPLALQQALDAAAPDDTLLLLRRLPCRLSLDQDASLDEAVQGLRQSLLAALQQAGAMADDSGLLRLRHPCDALNEAFADALAGRRDRAWAWLRLGLWPDADTPRAEATRLLTHLLPALDRRPLLPMAPTDDPAPTQRRRALLAALLSRGLLPRLLAFLAPTQWLQLATGLPGAEALPGLLDAAPQAGPRSNPLPRADLLQAAWPEGAEAAACLAALHGTPLPAARRAAAARWLAWLAWLQGDAIGLAATPTAQLQGRLRAMAQGVSHTSAGAPSGPATRSAPLAKLAVPGGPRAATAEALQQPPAARIWRTAQAGLLHLLPLLPKALAGAEPPARSGTHPAMGSEAPSAPFSLSRERLLRLAVHGLGLAPADPVLAVWLGAAAPAAWTVPSPDGQAASDRAALQAAVVARLQRHLPAAQQAQIGPDPLPWLLQRGATLHHEPGRWLAVFDEADTRLRRCGLDRDPGPLPWLGLTVDFRYE